MVHDSVRSRLMADESCVEVGAFLSGGIDSSIVAAIAAKILREERGIRLKTFCISLAPDAPDRKYAAEVAKFIDSDHYDVVLPMERAVGSGAQRHQSAGERGHHLGACQYTHVPVPVIKQNHPVEGA